jgi:hypothetical protein
MLSLGGCPDVQTVYQDSVALARQQEAQREQAMDLDVVANTSNQYNRMTNMEGGTVTGADQSLIERSIR